MTTNSTRILLALALLISLFSAAAAEPKEDDFKSVVRMIEQFYGVKHQGIPFLARAGMKAVSAAARVKGGEAKRFALAGSLKVALFEDQEFGGDFMKFRASLNEALNLTWTPLVQTFSASDNEQTYIFVRSAGDKWNVLVVTIEPRDATVVQATLSQKSLAQILKDPESAGRTLAGEAAIIDQE